MYVRFDSGDMPRKLHGIDYFQSTKPDLLFRDVSLYTETIITPEQAPAVIHQAIAAACAGRGVAHLTLPQDVVLAHADGDVASVETLQPRPEIAASAEDVARIASRIDAAGSVLMMCGAGCHGAAAELKVLSDRLKAPLIHSVKGQDIMPYDDPRWMGGIGMIGSKPVYNAVMSADLLLMVGTDYRTLTTFPNARSSCRSTSVPRCSAAAPRLCSACLPRRGRRSNCLWIGSRRRPARATGTRSPRSAAPGTTSSTGRPTSRAAPIASIHRRLPAWSATSPSGMRFRHRYGP